jgi:RHS repeat-associated protein
MMLADPLLISRLRPWFACYSGSGARKAIAQKVNCRAGGFSSGLQATAYSVHNIVFGWPPLGLRVLFAWRLRVLVTVETVYNSDGLVSQLKAQNPTTGVQTTYYVYGTDVGGITPAVYRNDLVRAEIYPDSDDTTGLGDGNDGTYDRVEFQYNRQGQRIEMKDQLTSVHAYELDKLGRLTHDRVTTLATGVDGAVRRISTSYDIRGLREKVTSYDNATVGSGNVVNEVAWEYNDLGALEKEYQEHEGAKDANTLYVQYNADTTAASGEYTKGLRPTSVRYPNARLVHLTYGSSGSDADNLNRLDAIQADSGGSPGDTLAAYTYLGLGTVVIEDYQQPDVKLDHYTSGTYGGFDRFGRVVDQKWYDYGASADRDRYTYGYDRASNRTYRENTTASAKDEFYTYDGVNRLVNLDRGDLNEGKTAISGTPAREEDWGLDMTGNWSDYLQKTSGSTDLDQERTHNKVNEITDISETSGTAWATPAQDRNGNMTSVPKPASLASSLTLKWDAWNRLVEAKDGQTVIGVYEFDGLQRRVKRHVDSQAPDSPNGVDTYIHYFHNSAWQTLETRETTTESDQPENLQPKYQYVWSPRYIDSAVLRDKNTDTDGTCDDERLYFLNDANFNVTTLVDTNGDAVERYLYDAYGKVTMFDGSWANVRSASSYANVVLYTGRERDAETGLYHYRHRSLLAELGRFASRDPIRLRGGFVLYQYSPGFPPRREADLSRFDHLPSRIGANLANVQYQFIGPIWRLLKRCYKGKLAYDCVEFSNQFNAFEDECDKEQDKDEIGFFDKYGDLRAQRACGKLLVNPGSARYAQLCCVLLKSYKKEARDPSFDGDEFRRGFQTCLKAMLRPY